MPAFAAASYCAVQQTAIRGEAEWIRFAGCASIRVRAMSDYLVWSKEKLRNELVQMIALARKRSQDPSGETAPRDGGTDEPAADHALGLAEEALAAIEQELDEIRTKPQS